VAWGIWKHQNTCVFDNKRPSIQGVLTAINTQGEIWCFAGASKLQELIVMSLPFGAYGMKVFWSFFNPWCDDLVIQSLSVGVCELWGVCVGVGSLGPMYLFSTLLK